MSECEKWISMDADGSYKQEEIPVMLKSFRLLRGRESMRVKLRNPTGYLKCGAMP